MTLYCTVFIFRLEIADPSIQSGDISTPVLVEVDRRRGLVQRGQGIPF
jgi:hypothetical protein